MYYSRTADTRLTLTSCLEDDNELIVTLHFTVYLCNINHEIIIYHSTHNSTVTASFKYGKKKP